jgi:hypothetical protein
VLMLEVPWRLWTACAGGKRYDVVKSTRFQGPEVLIIISNAIEESFGL